MRVRDIVIGQTYQGRQGEPRTVTSIGGKRHGGPVGEVYYYTQTPAETKHCWGLTFANWAKTVAPPDPRDEEIMNLKSRIADLERQLGSGSSSDSVV